ncbi:hypothetical protein INR49_022467 [Caranx melampygus]|nr:hypothetical protein INR49_022467 [Caranx melampygus]
MAAGAVQAPTLVVWTPLYLGYQVTMIWMTGNRSNSTRVSEKQRVLVAAWSGIILARISLVLSLLPASVFVLSSRHRLSQTEDGNTVNSQRSCFDESQHHCIATLFSNAWESSSCSSMPFSENGIIVNLSGI